MKILLIQPKDGRLSVFRLPFRPLTLELLAAYADPHECEIYDMRVDETPLDQKLRECEPRLVGITCAFTVTVPTVIALAREIKALSPRSAVVVGGVHPSLLPDDFAGTGIDVIVHGAGERILGQIATAIETGAPLENIRNLHLAAKDAFRYTGPADDPLDFHVQRLPARHLTQKYMPRYLRSPKGQTTSLLVASRGCPHRCSFCAAWKVQDGRYCMRDPGNILEEIRHIDEDLIYFFDDNAFGNPAKMRSLAHLILKEGIRKEYQMWASADAIVAHEDLVALWAEAGLRRVFVGLESCSDEHLKHYRKKATVATNEQAHDILRRHRVDLSPTFIARYDFTSGDFNRLQAYLVDRQFLMPYTLIYTPLPGTDLWQIHQSELITRDYDYYDLYHLTMQPRHLSPAEFMTRFTDLYLQNPSWQAVARQLPVAQGILDGIANLRAFYGG